MSRFFRPMTLAWAVLPVLLVAMLTSLLSHRSANAPPVVANPVAGTGIGEGALSPAQRARRWEQFQSVHGKALEPEWSSEGTLVGFRLRSRGRRIHPEESASISAKDRSLAIAHDLNELEGLSPDTLWQVSDASPSARGDRIELKQIREGVPLLPSGKVTIELDERGQARSLVAEVVSNLTVAGERSLSLGAARDIAEKQGEVTGAARFLADRGRAAIWVQRRGPALQGRRSFEFIVGGNQIVIDAENGGVLSNAPAPH